jgi:predicted MFS family arabinose efflux permease
MRGQILLLTVGLAVTGSNSLVLSPILADVAQGLGTTPVVISRALAAYGGATALSAFLLAPRIDRVGPRRALSVGMAALTAATTASAAANHWLVLMLAQLLAGIGAGIVLPSIYALATTIAPKGSESAVLGRVLVGWSVSLVAGVPASALISDLAGWRASFLALAVLAAFSLLGSLRLPEGCRPHASVRQGLLEPLGYPTVRPLLLVCLAFMAAFYGVYAFLGDTLRVATGATAAGAGLAVLTYGIGFGLASLADRRVDRWGAERVLPWSLAAVALIYLALVPATRAIWSTALLTAVWGGANHLCLNALIVLLARAQPDRRGAVLGLNSAVTYLGALLGTGAAGLAYQRAGFMALGIGAAALLAVAALVAQFGGAGARQTYDAAAGGGGGGGGGGERRGE